METNQPQDTQSKATNTWFFERGDGFVFACEEAEAWGIMFNKSNWKRNDFSLIGMSDGKTYYKIIREGNIEAEDLRQSRSKISSNLMRYKETEERLRFSELLPEDNEKVILVAKLIEEQQEKLVEVDEKLKNFNKYLIKKAFDAELELARGNKVLPRNFDVMTPVESDRNQIISNLPRR
jgi:hypothetical protein